MEQTTVVVELCLTPQTHLEDEGFVPGIANAVDHDLGCIDSRLPRERYAVLASELQDALGKRPKTHKPAGEIDLGVFHGSPIVRKKLCVKKCEYPILCEDAK